MKKPIKSIPLVLEVIVSSDDRVDYVVRNPQNGQVLALCGDSDELVSFLNEITTPSKAENE